MFLEIKEYSAYLNTLNAHQTIINYNLWLNKFFEHENIKTIEDIKKISSIDIDLYYKHLKDIGLSSYSLFSYTTCIKSFYEFLKERKIVKENPYCLKSIKIIPKKERKYMNGENAIYFIKKIKKPFHKALYCLVLDSGLRFNEIKNIKIEDLKCDKNGNYLKVIGKGGKVRTVGYSNYTKKCIEEYLKTKRTYKNEDYLFLTSQNNQIDCSNINKGLKRFMKKCGFEDYNEFHFHSLRHSFASIQLEKGISIKEVQEELGHSNISTTQIYLHIDKQKIVKRMNENSIMNDL